MVLPQVALPSFPQGVSNPPASGKLVSPDLVFKELFDATVSTPVMASLPGQEATPGASKEIAAKTARKSGNGCDGQDPGSASTTDFTANYPDHNAELNLLSFLPSMIPMDHSSAPTADTQKEASGSTQLDEAVPSPSIGSNAIPQLPDPVKWSSDRLLKLQMFTSTRWELSYAPAVSSDFQLQVPPQSLGAKLDPTQAPQNGTEPLEATLSATATESTGQQTAGTSVSSGATTSNDQPVFTLRISPNSVQAAADEQDGSPTATPVTAATSTPQQSASPDSSDTTSNGKLADDHADEKQAITAVFDAAVPVNAATVSEKPVENPAPHPITEPINQEHATSTANAAPAADVRLQLRGDADQRIDVRVVQQPDGVRVTVRSNDALLTQSLQDRIPELTTRLEQHHFQTEIQTPGQTNAGHFNHQNSDANPWRDASNRNQNGAGQGRSGDKEKQKQKTSDEQATDFSSLLESRR